MVGEPKSIWLKAKVQTVSNTSLLIGENWPELLQVLFVSSQSQDPGQRESAFRIFTTTPGIIEKQHEATVLSAFTKGFKDSDVTVSWHLYARGVPANCTLGSNCRNGSILLILHIDPEEFEEEVLLFSPRNSQHSTAVKGFRGF